MQLLKNKNVLTLTIFFLIFYLTDMAISLSHNQEGKLYHRKMLSTLNSEKRVFSIC